MNRLLALMIAALALAAPATAQARPGGERLEKVVILMRHGVRSAMASPEELGRSSARPWPAFDVPPGHLTDKGARLVTLLGRHYRETYVQAGLLGGADDCATVHYWANRMQRTQRTAAALAEGLTPGCDVTVGQTDQAFDPLFDAPLAGVGPVDPARARAAILGRIGGDLGAWDRQQTAPLRVLEALLLQCETDLCRPAEIPAGVRRLGDVPVLAGVGAADNLMALDSPAIATGGLMESLLMGYAEGLPFAEHGWTGLDAARLTRAFAVHAASIDLRTRTPEVGRQTSSHLAARLLATVAEGVVEAGHSRPIGGDAPIVAIAGHDGTLTMLAGLLGLDWQIPSYGQNQAAPGGALVFERWLRADGRRVVRLRYVAQGLDQMRLEQPLSAAAPPEIAPVFLPGCSEAGPGLDCPLEGFADLVTHRLDPRFVGD